ncbi:MAG: VIT1/CCC1 transporter family protein [Nitrososphaerota archaeon]|nr:VIT1/CCC1 transporter family protein [Nitrososphaerota archaeon]MDG6945999.1 VIT1/CCC1 transporter family protein [Nitrososphaerota archaeon]MDG6949897.1 VIT1/CCC1 transporter family protein [Nitrososphaerota archaeon]
MGGSDGAIEGVAITSALNGAGLAFGTIAVTGVAFAVAGALSMFFSSYLSRRTEMDSLKIDLAREKMEIETEPEEEMHEMADLLKKDGYGEREVEVIMGRLKKDKELWLREMLRRELRVNAEDVSTDPYGHALAAGLAFFLLSILSLSPYLILLPRADALGASVTLSLVALFALGSRAFVPRNFRPRSGFESAAVGATAGVLLYVIGILFSTL